MRALVDYPIHHMLGRKISSEARVEFLHCDAYRHMTSTAYLEMAINHRFRAVLDELGFDTFRLAEETGVAFINREVHLDFRRFAQLDDILQIESWMDKVTASRMIVKVNIIHRETGQSCCLVTLTLGTYDLRSGNLVPIPKILPGYPDLDFESFPYAEGHPK